MIKISSGLQYSYTNSSLFWSCCGLNGLGSFPNLHFVSLFSRILGIFPRVPITTDITVTFMSHNFFNSLARSEYLFDFSLSFIFTLGSAESSFYSCKLKVGLIFGLVSSDPFVFQSSGIFCAFYLLRSIPICVYTICQNDQILISCIVLSVDHLSYLDVRIFYNFCVSLQLIIILLLANISHNRYWWSFTGIWVTASLLRSPELFSVFLPIFTIL